MWFDSWSDLLRVAGVEHPEAELSPLLHARFGVDLRLFVLGEQVYGMRRCNRLGCVALCTAISLSMLTCV